jgi:threonyl-tRNA synthetase
MQVKVLPISDKFVTYADEVLMKLKKLGIRCEVDKRAEKVGYKIREAQLERVPYMVIIGQKEMDNTMLSIRDRDNGDKGMISFDCFMNMLNI